MKQTTGKQKTVQPKAQVVEETAAGAQGVALAPPVSGVAIMGNQLVQRVVASEPENLTGLPDRLKVGVEALSGMSIDNVSVHYNSAKPAQLQALAYTQGTEIHVGPGQERHLPHEAWHVVQQAQGRVQPTMEMRYGVSINNDERLEHEANVMGTTALKSGTSNGLKYTQNAFGHGYQDNMVDRSITHSQSTCYPVQRVEDLLAAPAPAYEILNSENYSQNSLRTLNDLVSPLVNALTKDPHVKQTEYTITLDLNTKDTGPRSGVTMMSPVPLWPDSYRFMGLRFGSLVKKLKENPKVQQTEYTILLKLGSVDLDRRPEEAT